MIHPLLRLIATEPHLLGDHVEAYAELVGDEVSKASTGWVTRIGLYAAAAMMLGICLVLAGASVLLWAALPTAIHTAPWAMVVTPLVPLVVAVACVVMARSKPTQSGFDTVRRQLSADMAMLREVSAA